jgi:cardiolipin synthase
MADTPSRCGREPIRAEVGGNRLEVIERGDERLRAVLDLIASARTKLNVLMYMFNADEAGDAVRNALDAAACRGVDVKLLIDGFGSGAPHPFLEVLRKSGGDYCVFNPTWGGATSSATTRRSSSPTSRWRSSAEPISTRPT